jgi:hypothetical protein
MRAAKAIKATAVLTLALAASATAQPPSSVDPAQAAAVFTEAKILCERDHGRVWGHSLCGPIMLVDWRTRTVITNQPDHDGALKPLGAMFTGHLPDAINISDTPTEWAGLRWTQLVWPLPQSDDARHVTIAHELFHRIQDKIGLPPLAEADNGHLDTLEGRYLLQLEWRALAKAMTARSAVARRAAVTDALTFRAERYRRFPAAGMSERALEMNEAVAEYTGVRIGLTTPKARNAYAVLDLSAHVSDPSFVRSFAYATGPAYGLMLDRADPAWRAKLRTGGHLDQLLQSAMHIRIPAALEATAKARVAAYDDGALRATELKREADRLKRVAAFRALLIDGPVLTLPLKHVNYQFRPGTLVPLDDIGVVYPTLRLTDTWGILEVTDGGALVYKGLVRASVSAVGADAGGLKGAGWTLKLNPGWSVKSGARAGDLVVVADR